MTPQESDLQLASGGMEIIPCAGIPYRCDGFDPADWPGSIVPPAVRELAATLEQNTTAPDSFSHPG